jgi:hypothetical protein
MLGRDHHLNVTSKSVAAKTTLTVQRLWRQALWGSAAAAALLVAILSGRSDIGGQKAASVFAFLKVAPSLSQSSQAPPHAFDAELATRQLAQAVRTLTEDRDRLMTRLTAVEHDMEDMTGSIKEQIETAKTASAHAASWPDGAPPVPMTPADIAAMMTPVVKPAADAAASGSPAYGADIGSGLSVKALHTRWAGLRLAHPQLFEGLQPVVSLRENQQSNRIELRLVVGPFSNADAAAQLCALLGTFHLFCQPTMYDGRHLALQ